MSRPPQSVFSPSVRARRGSITARPGAAVRKGDGREELLRRRTNVFPPASVVFEKSQAACEPGTGTLRFLFFSAVGLRVPEPALFDSVPVLHVNYVSRRVAIVARRLRFLVRRDFIEYEWYLIDSSDSSSRQFSMKCFRLQPTSHE